MIILKCYNHDMNSLFPDTNPKITKKLIEMLRDVPPARKLEMVGEMNLTVKTLMMAGLKSRYPSDSPEILKRRLADLILGPETARKVYGELIVDSK